MWVDAYARPGAIRPEADNMRMSPRAATMVAALMGIGLAWLGTGACTGEKITDIKVVGNDTVATETILAAMQPALAVGQEVDAVGVPTATARTLLLKLGYFEEVQISAAKAEGGYALTVSVKERQRVAKIEFRGNHALGAEDLSSVLKTKVGRFVDNALLQRDAEALANLYDQRGFAARISEVKVSPQGEVTFVIAELTVKKVALTGLRYVKEVEARPLITLKEGAPYDAKAEQDSIRALKATGWFEEVAVEQTQAPDAAEGQVIVEFGLRERPGVLPERTGPPLPDVSADAVRAQVEAIRLNIQCAANVRINSFLLGLEEDVEKALARLAEAAKPAGAPADAVFSYAEALSAVDRDAEAQVQYKRAAEQYRQLVARQPKNPEPLTRLGQCLANLGQRAEAVETLRQAVALAPGRWQARVEFAEAAGGRILDDLSSVLATAASGEWRSSGVVRALVALLPWEKTQAALSRALQPGSEADPLVALAREAATNMAEARRLAPREPAALRRACLLVSDGLLPTLPLVAEDDPAVWPVVRADLEAFLTGLGDLTEKDPELALWAAMLHSFRAVCALSGQPVPGARDDELSAELQDVAARLTAIVQKWPRTLRSAGVMLGVMQFVAGQSEMAKATFESVVKQNPFDRMAYNGLLGLAVNSENWEEARSVLARRMEKQPAAEDHILLGKTAQAEGNEEEVLGHFREAIRQFPDSPLGYLATGGWLVHLGGSDAEAAELLTKGLSMAPTSAYGHAARAALALIAKDPAQATAELKAALQADPADELANALRDEFFTVQQ